MGIWHRGEHCNLYPPKKALEERKIGRMEKFVYKGWLPETRFISKKTPITAFGSCFAAHLMRYLQGRGFNVNVPGILHRTHGAGINNTFAVVQQFEVNLADKVYSEDLWWDEDAKNISYNDDTKKYTKQQFLDTEVFVVTLGLSEVWYNKNTGEVFWRAIPENMFDGSRHGFRLTSVEENVENLQRIVTLAQMKPKPAKVIFTLSPVPLQATFRPVSCMTANEVSKSILRVAVDQVVDNQRSFYWPSYELVRNVLENPYEPDNRHVTPETVAFIMNEFARYYLKES